MSSIVYILNENLEPLLSKNIRAVPSVDAPIAQFRKLYKKNSPPILSTRSKDFDNYSFVYIRRDTLFFVSFVDYTVNILETLHYLEQFYKLLKDYFEVKTLNKNLILDNSILVLELVEESLDFGVIQVTDSGLIKDYVRVKINVPEIEQRGGKNEEPLDSDEEKEKKHKSHHKGTKQELVKLKKNMIETWKGDKKKKKVEEPVEDEFDDDVDTFMNSDIAKTTVMAISWRTKGLHYSKNEFYLDVIEKVEYFMDFRNEIVRKNVIHGEIVCRSFLSGMPQLQVSINKILQKDKQFLANCKFHQCVSLESIEEAKDIKFIPPDGDFVLCKYELKRHVRDQPMIKLSNYEIQPKLKKFKLKLFLTVETHFKPTNSTSKLNIKISIKPLFKEYKVDLSKDIKSKCDEGKVLFNVSDDFLLWEIGTMKGGHGENKLTMGVEFALFNHEAFNKQQEELKTSMNPPPLRKGLKLEEIYRQVHEESQEDLHNVNNTYDYSHQRSREDITLTPIPSIPDTVDVERSNLLLMDFEIPYSTLSGLKIEYLKIEEDQLQYQSFPWVRYKTVSDDEYAYMIN